MNLSNRRVFYYIISFTLLIAVAFYFFDRNDRWEIPYSDFVQAVKEDKISTVVIHAPDMMGNIPNSITGELDNRRFISYVPHDPNLLPEMLDRNLKVIVQPASNFLTSLASWLNILFFVILIAMITGYLKFPGRNMMQFGNVGNKMHLASPKQTVKFTDVAGVDESQAELRELVDFLKFPHKYQRLGSRIPRGCLLAGPPGSGKTLLSRAVAGEAGVPFLSISGSDFVEVFVGMGASRVRDLFNQGKKYAPCIIFIDEIDAVGRQRGVGLGGGNDEREQTLNQLLVELDGFKKNDGVIIIAATNRPDVLDQALLRPGRFDRQIFVPLPDILGREAILNIHMRKVPVGKDVNVNVLACGTPGFSGADLANLVNEATLLAARSDQLKVTMHDFEMAKDKILLGSERKSLVMTDMDKRLTAYHEAGHALVSVLLPASDPVHKVTIIPRGQALGIMMRLPKRDKLSVRKDQLVADIAVALAGREAELLIFGSDKISTGASSDFRMATNIAKRMVVEWGMSTKVGNVYLADEPQNIFNRYLSSSKNISDKTSELIDQEVNRILSEGQATARKSLKKYRHILEVIVQELLIKETLNGYDLAQLIEKQDPSLNIHKLTEGTATKANKNISKNNSLSDQSTKVSKLSQGKSTTHKPTQQAKQKRQMSIKNANGRKSRKSDDKE